MSNTWLISGANRGIGLGYATQLLAMGEKVIAGVRDPDNAESLTKLTRQYKPLLSIGRLDMNDWDSIDSFAGNLEEERVDYLINNAGLYGGSWTEDSHRQSADSMDYELWEEIMRVNVIAQFRLTRALEGSLMRGDQPLVVMMSSDMGSIGNNDMGQSYAYRTSKAALNMIARSLAVDLRERGIRVISMAPGWTQTALGGWTATWSVEDSVAKQIKVITTLGPEDTGKFLNLHGESVPW
ncbi:MAG: SDR family oxidoreductase [Gammaproteobacteria bacterium]|nr:SDR family oxidoreductase [Chromatiales bacterium]MYA29871.1 SDR family oxidoreductase [Gammaproteobacteria bacterium]MYE47934.1 SDR family oxidoreductase [Gammaproteobacteria bacterium]MYF67035.1 SDR family oxidoreductase [Gammaproteobacteria bacterium]MYK36468.1 SDR family oxidoreductase [Gammaproteobacteria bacterium]